MKITFIHPTVSLGGGTRVAAIYARHLTEMGHEVVSISTPLPQPTLRERLRRPFRSRVAVPAPKSHFDDGGVDHRVLERSRAVEDRDVPDGDIVIATWWETAEWVARLSPSKGTKLHFVQGHEVFDWLPVERCKASYLLPLHKIVVSKWLERVLAAEYGITQVDLVPNSVDHQQFFATERGKREHPTVGFLYSDAQMKGVDVTLRAIAELRVRMPTLRVVSFGAQAPEPGALGDVEFHLSPPQETLRELYARCDVWMTASRSEGFNLPAMEAMACRVPVVSTRTGWPEEAVHDGVNGWCVEIDDVPALVAGAQRVLSLSGSEWRAMSARAFETVRGSSWAASAALFERALVEARARSVEQVRT